jgi:hypothetical protein
MKVSSDPAHGMFFLPFLIGDVPRKDDIELSSLIVYMTCPQTAFFSKKETYSTTRNSKVQGKDY